MPSPSQNPQNNRQQDFPQYPNQPHSTHASIAPTSPRARTGSSSRTGPTSFSNILNPVDGDWSSTYPSDPTRSYQGPETMTQNGSNLDGAAATSGFYSAPGSQQLPESSRAFDLFMTRATLDTLTGIDPAIGARPEPMATTNNASSSTSNFPRPSYLEGSHYLARLEQQTQQRAISQWESNGVQTTNGHNGIKSESYLGISRDVVERPPVQEDDDSIDPLPTRWGTSKEDKAAGLEVMADGLEVKFTGPKNRQERDHDACAIRADHPMPLQCGLYYFEITILSQKHNE